MKQNTRKTDEEEPWFENIRQLASPECSAAQYPRYFSGLIVRVDKERNNYESSKNSSPPPETCTDRILSIFE